MSVSFVQTMAFLVKPLLPSWCGFFLIMKLIFACETDLDCSLNGICNGEGVCECDKPWNGSVCDSLMFLAVDMPQGYGEDPQLSTWGGGIIFDENTNQFHLYVSAMTNDCPLEDWTTNSRIDHGISDIITGPYEFKDVAVNTWAHNSAPIILQDGSYAIVHIGDGSGDADGGSNCSSDDDGIILTSKFREEKRTGSTIHVSDHLDGPWEPLSPNLLGDCNNPAPWVHPNGTIYIVCGEEFLRSDSISGPWELVSTFSHDGGPEGDYEDPYLYTDARGNFHCLYHVYDTTADQNQCVNSTVSAHIFSADGYIWFTSPRQPYTTQIELTTGEVITVSTRERPKMFFNVFGVPTHLINGVCEQPQCPGTPCVNCKYDYPDYTLIQPLDV